MEQSEIKVFLQAEEAIAERQGNWHARGAVIILVVSIGWMEGVPVSLLRLRPRVPYPK